MADEQPLLPTWRTPVPPPMEPWPVPDPGPEPGPDHPLRDAAYAAEVKWDGIRLMAACRPGEARLFTRRLRDRTEGYPEVAAALAASLAEECVLDGELVVFWRGRPSLPALLRREGAGGRAAALARSLPATYMVFDLLRQGAADLCRAPWEERRARLASLLAERAAGTPLLLSAAWTPGLPLFREARARQLEGVVLKRRAGPYLPGRRSREWLKIKLRQRMECVVGGYAARAGHLSSLLLGLFRAATAGSPELAYVGRAGSGFSEEEGERLRALLAMLEIPRCPFAEMPERPRDPGLAVRWTEPRLTVVVEFLEWTEALRLRGPVYVGLGSGDPAACLLP